MKAFIEWFGCSANQSDAEQIKGFLKEKNYEFSSIKEADLVLINTCAVKEPTEFKMQKRIKFLLKEKKEEAKLVVFGCLPKINPEAVKKIDSSLAMAGPNLEELTKILGMQEESFSPKINEVRENEFVSIIQIERGCLNNCTFCGTVLARGKLKSYSINELNEKFRKAVKETKEIWLTGQDTGCYGFDLGASLPELLKELLKNEGNYRIRIGMMNPHHVKKIYKELIEVMKDKRMYKFLHIPIQSGSNKVLKEMARGYSIETAKEVINELRKGIPGLALSTDIIAGFPGETDEEFRETMNALNEMEFDVVNISRYGKRPGTFAAKRTDQVLGPIKKERSRIASGIIKKISFKKNKEFEGTLQEVLVSSKGRTGLFVGRTSSYKQVIVKEDLRGKIINAKIRKAFTKHLDSMVLSEKTGLKIIGQ